MEGRISVSVFYKFAFEDVLRRALRIFEELCKSFNLRAPVIQQHMVENAEKTHWSWVLKVGGDLETPNAKDLES